MPTSVALGPDGNYYVGQLTGLPFPVGAANIYRVPAAGGPPQIVASGFTHIVDLTFGPDGSLYVVEIAKNGLLAAFNGNDWTGALIRIAPDGTRTELVPGVLTAPGGVAVGSNGDLYVTNNSIYSDIGQVIRIRPQTPRFVSMSTALAVGLIRRSQGLRLPLGLLKGVDRAAINMPSVTATGVTLEKQSSGHGDPSLATCSTWSLRSSRVSGSGARRGVRRWF